MARIVFLGNFRWRWCTEVHVMFALDDLGHDVVCLQEDTVTVDDIAAEAHDADLLLFTRTWGNHDPEDMRALWRKLAANGVPTASYHLDLYVGLDREADLGSGDPFWLTDCVFHPDGSPHAAERLWQLNINHHVLPPCVDRDSCVTGTPRGEFAHPVVFVGSALPYGHAKEWPFRDQLVGFLADRYRDRFVHYGPGGRRTVRNGMTGPDDRQLNDLYASARVVVGDSIYRPGYVSDRLTETLGRGGLLVFPRSDIVDALGYQPYRHYIPYEPGDLETLGYAVDFALNVDDRTANLIRRDARHHTRAHHTFHHRMAELLDVMGVR